MLEKWDFNDEVVNSTTPQINRQKSAQNLVVVEFDASVPRGVFFDAKRGTRHAATLSRCDCGDFNFVGTAPRKTFKPCMHIYRLAIELGIIEAKYMDHDGRSRMTSGLARAEVARLQQLARSESQWGGWSAEIHESGMQKVRQYRGYGIAQGERNWVRAIEDGFIIHDYKVMLADCDCGDCRDRRLPCKHIYAAALLSNISLPFSPADYEAALKDWKRVPLFLGGRGFTFAEYEATKDKALAIAFDLKS